MSKISFVLAAATLTVTALSVAASGTAIAGPHGENSRVAVTTKHQAVTVTHKARATARNSLSRYTHVSRRGRDVVVDAPTTMVETRGNCVAVDAPFAHVRRSTAGVHVRAPFVDLWVPRR